MNLSSRLKQLEDILFDPAVPSPGRRDPRMLVQRILADPEAYAIAKRLADRLPNEATAADIIADPEIRAIATALRERLNAIHLPEQL